jgi:hypothetical protein
MKNKLIFNNKEFELIEINHDYYIISNSEGHYSDIGFQNRWEEEEHRFRCNSIRIKDKYYGLIFIRNIE